MGTHSRSWRSVATGKAVAELLRSDRDRNVSEMTMVWCTAETTLSLASSNFNSTLLLKAYYQFSLQLNLFPTSLCKQ